MAVDIPKQEYTGNVRPITLGSGDRAITVGGETAYPFYTFEGEMPNQPRIAIQVLDVAPDDWAAACLEPWQDVVGDPVAWAQKAQDVYNADMIQLWLKSTDPNGLNRSAEEAAQTAKAVAEAISVPLIVWGTTNVDKDAEVLKAVAEACAGKDIIIGPVVEDNHKQLGAQALAYNMTIIANSPIDINLAKQLNILLNNVGVSMDKIIIDPTTGGLGYGIEYTYSVMERIRQAAITQDDDKLQCPFLCNMADEVWKTKEAKLPGDELMGDAAPRGILMEAITATTLLNAGADILVMRHPEAIAQVRAYLAELGGFEVAAPARAAAAGAAAAAPGAEAASAVADSLAEGSLCKIVKIMDMPVDLAPGYAMALIKTITPAEAGEGLVLGSGATRAAGTAEAAQSGQEAAPAGPAPEAAFTPEATWTPLGGTDGDYEYALAELENATGSKVKVIQDSYESGPAHGKNDWRCFSETHGETIRQVKTNQRYWYGEGYGSEKRKKPA